MKVLKREVSLCPRQRPGDPRSWGGIVKLKVVAVMIAATAMSLASASSAAAQPHAFASEQKTARPPQVSGSQLEAALLPPSAFGPNFAFSSSLDSGSKLQSTRATKYVPSLTCNIFETTAYVGFLGDTAGAYMGYTNPGWRATFPDSIIGGWEDVLQFASTGEAATLYGQARAKFAACGSFSYTGSGYTFTGDTLSVSNTTVDGDRAFVVIEYLTVPGYFAEYHTFLYVVAGTNVYSTVDVLGTNDEPSPALMSNLIHGIQALYSHK
jgi:hypothetical protein